MKTILNIPFGITAETARATIALLEQLVDFLNREFGAAIHEIECFETDPDWSPEACMPTRVNAPLGNQQQDMDDDIY